MRRDTLKRIRTAGREGRALVRAVDVETGEEILIDPVQDASALGRAAAAALRADASGTAMVEGRCWFLTLYNGAPEIVIIGAVHIAQALAALATVAGHPVRIIDPRRSYATADRFPGQRLICAWPDEALAAEPLTARSTLVVLSHDAKLDDNALAAGLRSPARYIGALGSAQSHQRRLARLAAQGFSDRQLARIHGPVGLPIGARAPNEIAIAILAELVLSRRTAQATAPIGGMVLAAGRSSRMGRNKLLLPVGGKPLLRHAVEAALGGMLDPVLVVTGPDEAAVRAVLSGLAVTFVPNPAFASGLSTSLRAGIAHLPVNCEGAMILLGDMPCVSADLVTRMCDDFTSEDDILAAAAEGRRGHPVLWGRRFFSELAQTQGDKGARELLARHAGQVRQVVAKDHSPLIDIDTPADLGRFAPDMMTGARAV